MKFLKVTLIVIVSIVAIVLVLGLVAKNEIKIERTVVINKPKADVFNYIKLIKNEVKYNKWPMADPNLRVTYTGTDGTPGFTSKWDSDMKEVGSGEHEIKKITEGERVDTEVRFFKPFEGKGDSYMTTQSAGDNQSKVAWGFYEKMKYPMNVMLLFIDIPGMLGKDMDESLNTLKSNIEKQ